MQKKLLLLLLASNLNSSCFHVGPLFINEERKKLSPDVMYTAVTCARRIHGITDLVKMTVFTAMFYATFKSQFLEKYTCNWLKKSDVSVVVVFVVFFLGGGYYSYLLIGPVMLLLLRSPLSSAWWQQVSKWPILRQWGLSWEGMFRKLFFVLFCLVVFLLLFFLGGSVWIVQTSHHFTTSLFCANRKEIKCIKISALFVWPPCVALIL